MPFAKRTKATILLIEDEAPLRVLVAACLRNAGFNVLEAADPVNAAEIVGSEFSEIDVLLTDINLPHQNGQEFARQLISKYPNLKVIFASGSVADDPVSLSPVSQGRQFLAKPYTPAQLLTAVREVLASHPS